MPPIPPGPPGPPPAAAAFLSSSFISATSASVVSIRPAIEAAFCRREAGNLGWINYAHLDHVAVLAGLRVEAVVLFLRLADLADHHSAFCTGVVGDLADGFLERALHDADANGFVIVQLELLDAPRCSAAAPCRRRERCLPRRLRGWRAWRPQREPSFPSARFRLPRPP